MAAAVASRPPDIPSRTPTPPPSLSLNTTSSGSPAAIPNKHIPFCSPGPTPYALPSPPASPPSNQSSPISQSLLYPPEPSTKLSSNPSVYAINTATVALALDQQATRRLAQPHDLFPWLHGLHPQNTLQQAFFTSRNPRKTSRRDACRPPLNHRFVTLVKAGGDLSSARLKGTLAPDEILSPLGSGSDLAPCFQDVDPRVGFSVRNFQIQACKIATISDIVVYGDDATPRRDVEKLAGLFAQAQANLRDEWINEAINATDDTNESVPSIEEYNTFMVTDKFREFEQNFPSVIAVDSAGVRSGQVLDFLTQERIEMSDLSAPSRVAENVFLGSTPDPDFSDANSANGEAAADGAEYSVMIEGSDLASMPEQETLTEISNFLDEKARNGESAIAHLEVPSSGSYLVSDRGDYCTRTLERLLGLCRWMWDMSHQPTLLPLTEGGEEDSDGDTQMDGPTPASRRILIHCADGYTETTLLALAYYMYAHAVPLHTAIVDLHVKDGRNFFAYPTDKQFLLAVESKLVANSPSRGSPSTSPGTTEKRRSSLPASKKNRPDWLSRMDGSLPSRVLPHLYLGNFQHAMNPALLALLGITRVLSVGEPIQYAPDQDYAHDFKFLRISGVQDNGVDPLRPDFNKSLAFIDEAEQEATDTGGKRGKVLVHCRVGVSRSATIVIAAVMKRLGLSFPRAYCYVRARRLNVIVQPHLRFVYELLQWEEELGQKRGTAEQYNVDYSEQAWKGRELEWPTIAREIAAMNRPYCRQ